MKVYMMTDMEGISGINLPEMTGPDNPQYAYGRWCLTSDVNAAVAGAFDGGATEVIVNDGHGGSPHIIMEEADPRAEYEKPAGGARWLPSLDQSCDCMFLVGAHARAGTLNAFLDHTQSSLTWFSYEINGIPHGEMGQQAVWGGAFGVPLVLVTGDVAACEEARAEFSVPETVAVKQAIGRQCARCIHPRETAKSIREAAARAVQAAADTPPYVIEPPMTVRCTFTRADHADGVASHAGVTRIDARTVEKVVDHGTRILILRTTPGRSATAGGPSGRPLFDRALYADYAPPNSCSRW